MSRETSHCGPSLERGSELAIVVVAAAALPTLQVRGEVDIATAPQLRRSLDTIIGGSTGEVVVDLDRVPFIDATGLQVLLDAQQRLVPAGRRVTITPGSAATWRVAQLAAVTAVFDTTAAVRSTGP